MDCEYNIKEYDAIIQQIVDLDRQKLVYPITIDSAVILTDLKESPISLKEYVNKLKEYFDTETLYLYNRLQGETPDGKAYRAVDGLKLENDINLINNSINSLRSAIEDIETQKDTSEYLQNQINSLKDNIQLLNNAISNIQYEYELLLFKVTDSISYIEDSIVHPEEPIIDDNGNILNGWDISYSTNDGYVWLASTIVKVKGFTKNYQPWKVTLLYDKEGNYVGGNEKYEKSIYCRTKVYNSLIPAPDDSWQDPGSIWEEEPKGVSPDYPYEYVSSRWFTLNGTALGNWSTPVLWSRWGANGQDSANIEYIYCALDSEYWPYDDERNPEKWVLDDNFQNNEYIRPNQSTLWFDNPVGLTESKPYQYVSIRKRTYDLVTDSYNWQSYSEPTLWSSLGKDGQDGTPEEVQGLMGPVVRFKGVYSSDKTYVNMKNDTSLESIDAIRYVDFVKFQDNFYMVAPIEGGTNTVINKDPFNYPECWVQAENFEFIATDVLYSEEGKIDYLASNEVVIFDKNPQGEDVHIVAGMTGGDSEIISGNSETNPVRIWAGSNSIYNDESPTEINLQEAPFRVHEDGKLVATNAEITGNISAQKISLTGNQVFWYNQNSVELPSFNRNQHVLAYILLYNNNQNCILNTPGNNTKILYYKLNEPTNERVFEKVSSLTIEDNNLYTLISNYDSGLDEYQWVISSQGIYYNTISVSDVELDREFEILTENYQTNTGDPTKVQLYLDSIIPYSSSQEQLKLYINFRFKLGDSLEGVTSEDILQRANLQELLVKLQLPSKDSRDVPISYKFNSDSSFCIINFPQDIITSDSSIDPDKILVDLMFGSKNGQYVELSNNISPTYSLVLDVISQDNQNISLSDLSEVIIDYLDTHTIKLLRK